MRRVKYDEDYMGKTSITKGLCERSPPIAKLHLQRSGIITNPFSPL